MAQNRRAAAIAAVLLLILGGAAASKVPGARARAQENACRANLQQVSMAMLMYRADYDQRFPPGERWSTLVGPYLRNNYLFRCPSRPRALNGYAMNSHLSLKPLAEIPDPERLVMLFESGRGRRNAADPLASVEYRHPLGAHYACADGHVGIARQLRERDTLGQ